MAVARRALLAAVAVPGTAAASVDEPQLEVVGAIGPPEPRRLTRAQIDTLGRVELLTRTPWTVGPQRFAGLPMQGLLAVLAAQGTTLTAVALNDYSVTMPIAELVAADGFLATHQDGAPIPVRLRGPFWIVFPWSQRPELDTAANRQRAVWQLQRLDIA